MPQPRGRHFQALPPPLGGRFRRPPQPEAQLIHLLLATPDHLAHALHGAMLRQLAQPSLRQHKLVACRSRHALPQAKNIFLDHLPRLRHHLGRCRRRRRPQIGDKIGNGEIGLVADRRDYRDF